ncbi:MAG: sigma-70 family RNA polymerase sigma factor [bacterium]|nr:sigma-70 family RNA polymerase sigma factor [bacterium]
MNEKDLIKKCLDGDSVAQRCLYDQFGPQLMGLCMRYTGLREDAEEVFHDSLMKVFKNLDKFQGGSSLKTWINRIGVNTALDFLRKRKNALLVEHISDSSLDIKDTVIEQEICFEAEVAMKLMHKMPLNQQIIINLFVIDELSHKEIAAQLNISEEASRSQYSRAKRTLTELVKTKLNTNEQQR